VSGYVWTVFGRNFLFMAAGVMMILVFFFSIFFTKRIVALASQQSHL